MAPSPEQHNEPKAPDKNESNNKASYKSPINELQKHLARFQNASKANSDSQEKKVSALDDGQLRDLLEEAVSYKCPKDRHGKSPLFMELLQRAEADERNQRATNASGSQVVRHYNTAYSQRNRNKQSKEPSAAERNSHGGSLQNLYQVNNDHTTSRKTRKKTSVSARQREGGSLPSCNIVPADKITFEKPPMSKMETSLLLQAAHALNTMNPEYTTIDLSNADPEETQSLIENDSLNRLENSSDMKEYNNEEEGTELEVIHPMHFTSRANLEISDSSKTSEGDTSRVFKVFENQRKVTNGLETNPLQLASNYSSGKCIMDTPVEGATAVPKKPLSSITKDVFTSVLSIPPHRWIGGDIKGMHDAKFSMDKLQKVLDENENSVNSNSSVNVRENRKAKKPKADRNVTIFTPESRKGFCGDKELDVLVKFIEATTNDKHNKNRHIVNNVNKTNKNVTNFNKMDDRGGAKKRSTERRSKDKSEKLKKSNSLEEISKTKLEDLTTEIGDGGSSVSLRRTAKKQATFDDGIFADKVGDRRSWGTEEGQQYYCNDNAEGDRQKRKEKPEKSVKPDVINTNPEHIVLESVTTVESSDFLVVTKKKKSKKRRSSSGGRGNLFNDENRRNNYYSRDNQSKFPAHDHCDSDMLYLNNFQNSSPDHRRKSTCSMPPSDKSNDSSDLDSVHSLPVESTSTKMCLQQVSTSSGGTPQASYADITKMANVNTASTYSTNYGVVDIKNAEKWPSVTNSKTPPLPNKILPTPTVMSAKNYNFPDLIIDNYTDSCNLYNEKMFTTVSEIEARHLSEAKINFKLKNGKTDIVTSPPNSRILQDQYPALEKTVPMKVEVKNVKKLTSIDKNNIACKSKLKSSNSEVLTTATKGCDIDKKLSNTTMDTSQDCHDLIVPNNLQKACENPSASVQNHLPPSQAVQRKPKKQAPASRPAVIILNDTDSNSSGITFGFEVNEQLLRCDSPECCSLENGESSACERDDEEPLVPVEMAYRCSSPELVEEATAHVGATTPAVDTPRPDFAARFIPPAKVDHAFNYNHDKIVAFVGLAWEDIMSQQNEGKVQYYNGQ